MIQTALIETHEQHLRLSNHSEGDLSRNNTEWQPLLDAILQNPIIQDISVFHYKKKIRLDLRVNDTYKSDYVLLKGLIEFHRPKNFGFTYDRDLRSVTADVRSVELEQLSLFLSRVAEWLDQERRFRRALKKTLEFERRYNAERESVYRMLRNATVAAHAFQR